MSKGSTLEEKIKIAENPDYITFLEKKDHIKTHQAAGGTRQPIDSKGVLNSIAGVAETITTILDPTRGAVAPSLPVSLQTCDTIPNCM